MNAQLSKGTIKEYLRCDSVGRQSRVITIEYNVKEDNWKNYRGYGQKHLATNQAIPIRKQTLLLLFAPSFLFN